MNTRILFCFLLASLSVSAQPYKNLVFEGGGIRGIAYAGALRELDERGMLQHIERVAGTSAGAIAALTVSLGYRPDEIEKIINDTKIQKFNDGQYFFIGGINRMNTKYGWYRGAAFLQWLEKIIVAKTGNANITFRQLHEQHFRDLYVTGTSLNHQKLIVFSVENYPDMKVKDAVRISMSIPLYFEAVCIDSVGRVLDITKAKGNVDLMVDGGFTGNFPIFIFDSTAILNGVSKRIANSSTIGLRIDSENQIAYDSAQRGLAPIDVERFKDYMSAFYIFVIENLNRSTLTADDWRRTISISSGNVSPKIRKLSPEEKEMLMKNGRTAVKEYFDR